MFAFLHSTRLGDVGSLTVLAKLLIWDFFSQTEFLLLQRICGLKV